MQRIRSLAGGEPHVTRGPTRLILDALARSFRQRGSLFGCAQGPAVGPSTNVSFEVGPGETLCLGWRERLRQIPLARMILRMIAQNSGHVLVAKRVGCAAPKRSSRQYAQDPDDLPNPYASLQSAHPGRRPDWRAHGLFHNWQGSGTNGRAWRILPPRSGFIALMPSPAFPHEVLWRPAPNASPSPERCVSPQIVVV